MRIPDFSSLVKGYEQKKIKLDWIQATDNNCNLPVFEQLTDGGSGYPTKILIADYVLPLQWSKKENSRSAASSRSDMLLKRSSNDLFKLNAHP